MDLLVFFFMGRLEIMSIWKKISIAMRLATCFANIIFEPCWKLQISHPTCFSGCTQLIWVLFTSYNYLNRKSLPMSLVSIITLSFSCFFFLPYAELCKWVKKFISKIKCQLTWSQYLGWAMHFHRPKVNKCIPKLSNRNTYIISLFLYIVSYTISHYCIYKYIGQYIIRNNDITVYNLTNICANLSYK